MLSLPRPVEPSDRAGLLDMYARCSPQTRYQRFHLHSTLAPARHIDVVLRDPGTYTAVIADGDELVGEGTLFPLSPSSAELALIIDDEHQGTGLGTALTQHLLRYTDARTIMVSVLADNMPANRLFRRLLGTPQAIHAECGVTESTYAAVG